MYIEWWSQTYPLYASKNCGQFASVYSGQFNRILQKVGKSKTIIEIRGIDNGIIMDFFFEKKNGKWILVTWIDSST
jgi:hypothetical protein